MNAQQEAAFAQLLHAWKRHHDARVDDASIRDLARARFALEDARSNMARSIGY